MSALAELRRLCRSHDDHLGRRGVDYIYGPFGPATASRVLDLTRAALAERIPGFHNPQQESDWLEAGRMLCLVEINAAQQRGLLSETEAHQQHNMALAILTPCGLLKQVANLKVATWRREAAYQQQYA